MVSYVNLKIIVVCSKIRSNDKFVSMPLDIGKQIPLINNKLILLAEKHQSIDTIEIENPYQDNLKNFINYLVVHMSSCQDSNSKKLKMKLNEEFEENEIMGYLHYLGLNDLFDGFYPILCEIQTVDALEDFTDILVKFFNNLLFYNPDIKEWSFFTANRWWRNYDVEMLICTIIKTCQPVMKSELQKIVKKKNFIKSLVRGLQEEFISYCHPLDNGKIIGFNDGIVDLQELKFRVGTVDDYVSKTVGYNFSSNLYDRFDDLMFLLKKIQPDESELNQLLKYTSQIFDKRTGFVFTGTGSGKDAYIDLIKCTFGPDYCGSFPSHLLTDKKIIHQPSHPRLLDFVDKRIMICDFPLDHGTIDPTTYTILLIETQMFVKPLKKQPFEGNMVFSIIITFKGNVEAFNEVCSNDYRRKIIFDFQQKNDIVENELLMDIKNINRYREEFIRLLLKIRTAFVQNDNSL